MKYLIKDLASINKDDIEDLKQCLLDRITFEELREPDSDGYTHDLWEERIDELSDMYDQLDEDEENLEDVKDSIRDFQLTYGGLSRLKL